MKPVLAVVCAHADDAELNAGGTMAKWVAQGGEVVQIMATNNCSGYLIPEDGDESRRKLFPPAETAAVRRREQAAAAKRLGAKVVELGYWQRHYWNGSRVVDAGYGGDPLYPYGLEEKFCIVIAANEASEVSRLADLLASIRPAQVLTQTPADIDPEHHAVATLVWQAMMDKRMAGVPLRFWTPSSGSPGGLFDPGYDHLEDISGFLDEKIALCACHASQMTASRWKAVRGRAAYFGARIGVAAVEPFRTAHWDLML